MNLAPAVPIKVSFMSTSPLAGEVGGEATGRGRSSPLAGEVGPVREARAAGWGRSRLGHLGKRHLRLLAEVPVVQLRHPLERVDLLNGFVVANSYNAREAQRIPAHVTSGMLDRVKRNLQHNLGFHHSQVSMVLDGDFE